MDRRRFVLLAAAAPFGLRAGRRSADRAGPARHAGPVDVAPSCRDACFLPVD
jgi:hypothetical protein